MYKKTLSFVLAGLMMCAAAGRPAQAASAVEGKEARFARRVKQGVQSLGTGEAARVEIRLRDKTKLKGYVSEAGEDGFVVVDAKSGAATRVPYPQVKQVKGHNLSEGATIAIGVGLLVMVIVLGYVAASSAS